jgi:predicted RNA-binding protein with TRAM domain
MSYRGGRFGGGSRFGGPKPVESGKEYDVQVTEISRKGDGVARIQGFIIFVKGGKVGQKTRVRVTHVGDRFATAETIDGGEQQPPKRDPVMEPQQAEHQPTEQSKDEVSPATRINDNTKNEPNEGVIVSPPVSEEEKPKLQDYTSPEGEEIKPEEQPPTG